MNSNQEESKTSFLKSEQFTLYLGIAIILTLILTAVGFYLLYANTQQSLQETNQKLAALEKQVDQNEQFLFQQLKEIDTRMGTMEIELEVYQNELDALDEQVSELEGLQKTLANGQVEISEDLENLQQQVSD